MKIINHYLLGILCALALFSTTQSIGQTSSQVDIITQCITNVELWGKAPQGLKPQSDFFILDHGVEFDIPQNFLVNDISTSLITKSDLSSIGHHPYFLFHTMNVEEHKAFVRLYLVYKDEDDEKTISQELNFIKTNNQWQLADSSF